MPDPAELLSVARMLCVNPPLSDGQLRRAISTAYYAVFHKVLRAAAHRFMGADRELTPGYGLLYRSFDHGHMRKVCESINVSTLNKSLQRQLGRVAVSQDMRNFAETFQSLQEGRHRADYDPLTVFSVSAAASYVDAAEVAIQALDRTPPEEQADILALLMVRPRA